MLYLPLAQHPSLRYFLMRTPIAAQSLTSSFVRLAGESDPRLPLSVARGRATNPRFRHSQRNWRNAGAYPDFRSKVCIGRSAIGAAIGLVLAAVLAIPLQGLLYATSRTDPSVYASVILLVLACTVLAAIVPATRAARIEPAEALRHE